MWRTHRSQSLCRSGRRPPRYRSHVSRLRTPKRSAVLLQASRWRAELPTRIAPQLGPHIGIRLTREHAHRWRTRNVAISHATVGTGQVAGLGAGGDSNGRALR
jgi:hypothetical protein